MLDFLFSLGQAASVMLLIYGGYLVMFSGTQRKPALDPALEDELLLLRHIRNDA